MTPDEIANHWQSISLHLEVAGKHLKAAGKHLIALQDRIHYNYEDYGGDDLIALAIEAERRAQEALMEATK